MLDSSKSVFLIGIKVVFRYYEVKKYQFVYDECTIFSKCNCQLENA